MKETKCFLAKKTGKHFQGHKETRKETIPTEVIRSTLAELNAAGSWADCPPLSDNEQQQAGELESAVDRAALADDIPALEKALDAYRIFWLQRLRKEPRQPLLFG
ncbi:MAG: hypothetical protein GXY54_11315 [Deltaproteobacteria bacterium]|nr:hypothetical protein [Deltaproteobacteria bacterium]